VGSYRILTTRRFLRHLKRLEGEVRERVLDAVREVSERP
jgi:mRNA-degrading endonuclease RelE of RelBE toxin-antitoxin system